MMALSAATCTVTKRKAVTPEAHESVKRSKTVQKCEETLESGCSFRSARISVRFSRIQQPITVNDLTELLHFAVLGKTGGIKQPR